MKELLKNRHVAIGITVVVILLSTLLGAHRSLVAAAYPIERYFIEGEGHSRFMFCMCIFFMRT